jgi:hypothetical protein
MVTPPANTGNDNINKKQVINIAQTNKGKRCILIPGARIFNIVVIILIQPTILLIPDKCKLKIAKSTLAPEWLAILDRGGYQKNFSVANPILYYFFPIKKKNITKVLSLDTLVFTKVRTIP